MLGLAWKPLPTTGSSTSPGFAPLAGTTTASAFSRGRAVPQNSCACGKDVKPLSTSFSEGVVSPSNCETVSRLQVPLGKDFLQSLSFKPQTSTVAPRAPSTRRLLCSPRSRKSFLDHWFAALECRSAGAASKPCQSVHLLLRDSI